MARDDNINCFCKAEDCVVNARLIYANPCQVDVYDNVTRYSRNLHGAYVCGEGDPGHVREYKHYCINQRLLHHDGLRQTNQRSLALE